ncbi:MAG: ATP-binding cassette domain-containing protein, partial [Pseudomonadota bacterium]
SSMTRDNLIAEMIAGRSTIKALALDRSMGPMWEERHADNIENAIARGAKADFYQNVGASLTMVTTIAMTSVGALAIITQNMTMGALIAANMLSGRLLGPLNQLVGQWRAFSAFRQSVERLGEAFALTSERLEAEVSLGKPKGEIVAERVVFSYAPDLAPVIDNVSVVLKPGGIHIFVGRNGSGKSTIIKLLMGLYQPQTGRILLDGADIAQFTRGELATWIGYVPQDCVLFAGSVRDNIAYRMPGATDEQVIKAATAAGVHHFIIDLPDGYATDIGEAGRRLSGGQRQRIAVARALVGEPVILVLDEPSSSLDRQAEHELRATLTELAKDHTVIMVTHSPVLLTAADDLVALDRGKVALAGPAKEILPRLFGQAPPPKDGAAAAAPTGTGPTPAKTASPPGAAAVPAPQPPPPPKPVLLEAKPAPIPVKPVRPAP